MPTFSATALRQLAQDLLMAAGASAENATVVADHLVEANLAGLDSHGVLRVLQYVELIDSGLIQPNGRATVENRFASGATVDGNGGFGQVVGRDATLLAIEIARESGVGAVTVRNCCHTGRIGTYTAMAAEAGMIGLAVVNAGGGAQLVPPYGGVARRLSTNPISIAAPSAEGPPVVLDMATTVAPEGKVRAAFQAGKPTPEGWLVDAAGDPTTDAAQLYADPPGALVPLGGPVAYKGYCLSFMVDILAGILTGAGGCEADRAYPGDGLFVLTIDVARFQSLADFSRRVQELGDYVRSSPKAPGHEQIYIPGEIERERRETKLREGLFVEGGTWNLLEELCRRFGVEVPK